MLRGSVEDPSSGCFQCLRDGVLRPRASVTSDSCFPAEPKGAFAGSNESMEPTTVLAVALGGFAAWKITRAFMGKVSPEKARTLVAGGARLVDVRSAGEYASGHLDGALNVPVQDLAKRMEELGDKKKPVVLYCASGMRSASAAGTLRRAGFADVHDLGAMARWG